MAASIVGGARRDRGQTNCTRSIHPQSVSPLASEEAIPARSSFTKPDPRTHAEIQLDKFLAKHWRDKRACREAIRNWQMQTFFFRRTQLNGK